MLETLKEARLELKYALLESEQQLARSLGLHGDLSAITLSEVVPAIKIDQSDEELSERAATANIEVLDKAFAVEEAEHSGVLNGREFSSNLSVSLLINPKYSPARSDTDDFGASFSDFFDEDAYLEPVIPVGLSIPLYDGGKADHRREIVSGLTEGELVAMGNQSLFRENVEARLGEER